MKFYKLKDNIIEEAPVNVEKDGQWICNYNLECNSEMLLNDGYKPLYEAEREENHYYVISYEELEDRINEVLTDITDIVKRDEKIEEYNKRIEELKSYALEELRNGNSSSVKIINEIIQGLEDTKEGL